MRRRFQRYAKRYARRPDHQVTLIGGIYAITYLIIFAFFDMPMIFKLIGFACLAQFVLVLIPMRAQLANEDYAYALKATREGHHIYLRAKKRVARK